MRFMKPGCKSVAADGSDAHLWDSCMFYRCVFLLLYNKTLREDRTAAEENCVAEATRRRRRIPRSRILFYIYRPSQQWGADKRNHRKPQKAVNQGGFFYGKRNKKGI